MTNNTFTIAGVSTLNGIAKVRFSNHLEQRMAMLAYSGHIDITLVELSGELTKLEAAQELLGRDEMQDDKQQAAIATFIEKNTPRQSAPRGRPFKLPTLDDVPTRENGKFIAKAVREQMLEQMIADAIAEKEAAAEKRKARAAKKADEAAVAVVEEAVEEAIA